METRKESLSALKVCRFCLTQNEPLTSLYEKNKAPKNSVILSTKIMTCLAVEVFPSDKYPQYICNRCKLFMDLSYGFKQICRQADQNILHFVQQGTAIEPQAWPSLLNKVYKAHTKLDVGIVKTITQDGSTVKVTAEEISDSEEGDDDNVYSVKIGDGSDELKSIKVITSVDNQENRKADTKHAITEGCWPCDECECTYPLEQLLTLHKAHKHRARTAECNECNAKFFTKYDLTTHQLRHCTELPFQCVACDKKFKRLINLKRHEKITHSELSQLKCEKCPATFLSEIELEAHSTKHERRAHPLECNICGKRYSDNSALVKHLDSHRAKPEFDCNYCPERFTTMTKLAKHLRSHAGERAYPCKYCDKSFIKSHHYTRHLRVKHMEMTRTASGSYTEAEEYRCEECEECFGTQDELMYHSALHATRSLTCPLCQEKFRDVDTVTAHIKSHVNGAEFMCDFCELIFTTEEKLDTHMTASHANELVEKDTTENEEDDSMDMQGFEDEPTINVTEEDGHMLVEIKKAGDYMLVDSVMEEDDRNDNNSEGSELEIRLNDATAPLLGSQPKVEAPTPVTPPPRKHQSPVRILENVPYATGGPGSPNILKKAEEVKKKVFLQQPSPIAVPITTVKKENLPTPVKSESTVAAGASDLSLRLLEKELQDLKRTNTRNDVAKTPAKLAETLKSKRLQTTSTPKLRTTEKKEVPTSKTAPEKAPQDKRPLARAAKEPKEVKNISAKEDKAIVTVKEEKETKDIKEKDTPKVAKNGISERASVEEPVRRSARPSKVKDYAKMISDSPTEEEMSSDEEPVEESKEAEKSIETPRRGRKQAPKPSPAAPARKRGRPRRSTPIVPAKVSKPEPSDDDEQSPAEATKDIKSNDSNEKTTSEETETKSQPAAQPTYPASDIIISPSGQTLKKVPVKSLPPGVKPLPLPRKMASGELCEMQIGKKVVKVQKIVMTKAEVEAMTKKGLVEMKDGTIVLKPGIKLGGGGVANLKSQLAQEQKMESPNSKPTRCDLGGD